MGYGTDRHGRLTCDSCGVARGVRKIRCPFKIRCDNLHSPERQLLDFCTAPALCPACVAREGGAGSKGVHKRCKGPARIEQAKDDAVQARLDAGEWKVVAAAGDWHYLVPAGMVGVTFGRAGGRANGLRSFIMPADQYDPRTKPWYSDYAQLVDEGRCTPIGDLPMRQTGHT
jgi:hypothetical protein